MTCLLVRGIFKNGLMQDDFWVPYLVGQPDRRHINRTRSIKDKLPSFAALRNGPSGLWIPRDNPSDCITRILCPLPFRPRLVYSLRNPWLLDKPPHYGSPNLDARSLASC